MAGHGPDVELEGASEAELKPHKIEGTMAFMVESCWPFRPTAYAMGSDYASAAMTRERKQQHQGCGRPPD
jgi:homogentisate 1,2-dioxygenase